MTPIESMGFDLATLRTLTLGNGEISLPALSAFGSKTDELIRAVWATDRSNPPERQELKQDFVDLMRDHVWVPTIACAIYVFIVFVGPHFVRNPWPVKPVLVVWNLLLSVFSAVGSYHCMGGLLANMAASGWRYTVCTEPKTINLVNTDLDVWACFFVLSKIFEFFDTILKILLKKDFIFLHWYHHLATAYLCWLSLAYNFAPGTWIAALNYTVHAPMYFYYFLSSVLSKKWFTIICKPVAPIITTMQTSQMAMFTVVNCSAVYYLYFEEPLQPCSVLPLNLYSNAAVVFSYFVLFLVLFVDKYIRGDTNKGGSSTRTAGEGSSRSSRGKKVD